MSPLESNPTGQTVHQALPKDYQKATGIIQEGT